MSRTTTLLYVSNRSRACVIVAVGYLAALVIVDDLALLHSAVEYHNHADPHASAAAASGPALRPLPHTKRECPDLV
jgi:hypothetical protein